MSIEQDIVDAVRDAVTPAVAAALDQPRLQVPAAYRIPDAARALDCSVDRIRRQITAGRIPTIDVGGRGGLRIPGWWVHGFPAPSVEKVASVTTLRSAS